MEMKIKPILNSLMNSMTYILYTDTAEYCYLVDCGYSDKLLLEIAKLGKSVKGIFVTHSHYDHIYGLNVLLGQYPDAVVYTNANGHEGLFDTKLNFSKYHPEIEPFIFLYPSNVGLIGDNDVIQLFPDVEMRTMFTPGHDISCISYIIGNKVFTGDSYIPGCKLVNTFPRSNKQLAKENEQKLKDMESNGCKILPGHWIKNLLK